MTASSASCDIIRFHRAPLEEGVEALLPLCGAEWSTSNCQRRSCFVLPIEDHRDFGLLSWNRLRSGPPL